MLVSAQTELTMIHTSQGPTCFDPNSSKLGDGICDEGTFHNTEACGWDSGDCDVNGYPDCHPPFPSKLGDNICNPELSVESCGFDLGDCDGIIIGHTDNDLTDNGRTKAETAGIVFGAMAIVTVVLLSQWVFIRSRNQYSNMVVVAALDAEPRAPNVHILVWNAAALFPRGARKKREQRINLVMNSIIRKKVLSRGDQDSDIVLLPHEQIVSIRSSKMSAHSQHSHHSNKFTNRDEDDDVSNALDEEESTRWQKDDIYIDSCSMHSTRQHKIVASSHHSSLYSPRSCPICYEKYKSGDEIAWSHNEKCLHAFHVKCIIEWLVDNDDCPMCRSNYVHSAMDEFPIDTPNEIATSEVIEGEEST